MSPRRRSLAKRGLPPNLYERKGYYSWRNPVTREEYGIGRNKAVAIQQTVEANNHFYGLVTKPRVIDRLTGDADRSVAAWSLKYAQALQKVKRADNTRRTYASLNRRIVALLGSETPIKNVTALHVTNALDQVAVTENKPRLAQALRHFMRDWFREAIVQGWITDNPVIATKLSVRVEVKRARLSLDVFQKVYAVATPWLQNAMALALVSAQRREDISEARFADFRDGGWWCQQSSEKSDTPHKIFIPLDLKLNAFGMSLSDVLSQCRKSGALSRYLVHQTEPRGNSPVGSQIWVDTISRRFSAALKGFAIDWGGHTPPTFHEIRSLAERLYRDQGGVNTQHLLGHNEESTTLIYNDSRGSQWTHALDGRKIVSE